MAQTFCPDHGDAHVKDSEAPPIGWGKRPRRVGRGYRPEGYPNPAVICQICDKEALVWLGDEERSAYRRGDRIFNFQGGLGRVRVR